MFINIVLEHFLMRLSHIFLTSHCLLLLTQPLNSSPFCPLVLSCIGRIDPNFDDENHSVVDDAIALEPDAMSMEMESYILLHLAQCSKVPIYATAASIVVANRKSSQVIDEPTLLFMEAQGSMAALKTLILQTL
jgi:hypothetical protein